MTSAGPKKQNRSIKKRSAKNKHDERGPATIKRSNFDTQNDGAASVERVPPPPRPFLPTAPLGSLTLAADL